MIVPQILRKHSNGLIMRPRDAPIGPFLTIVTLSAAIAARGTLEVHPIMRAGFHDIMILGFVQNRVHGHRAVMAREAGQ